MWDLVPCLRIEPRPPVLGAQILSHWTTRGVPDQDFRYYFSFSADQEDCSKNLALQWRKSWGVTQIFCTAVFRSQSFSLVFVRGEVESLSCQPSPSLPSPSTPLLPPFHILHGGHWSMLDLLLSTTPSQLHGTFVSSIEEALLVV